MLQPDDMRDARLHVDGELAPDDRTAFERRLETDPALRDRVELERGLREAVSRTMSAVSVPSALRDRVRQALADAPETDTPAVPTGDGEPRRRWYVGPTRANALAVAASLAVVAAAVLIGVFGRPIDQWGVPSAPADLVGDVALFVAGEHDRCAGNATVRSQKAMVTDPAAAAAMLSDHLGAEVTVCDLEAFGYRFIGAGPCGVPGGKPSGHLMYAHPGGPDEPAGLASVFIVPDLGQFDSVEGLERGQWYESPGGPRCRHEVIRSTDGRLAHFLVCCREGDLDRLAGAIGAALGAGRRPGPG